MSYTDPCSNCGDIRASCTCGDWNGMKAKLATAGTHIQQSIDELKPPFKVFDPIPMFNTQYQPTTFTTEYQIVNGETANITAMRVNALLKEGWILQGSLQVTCIKHETYTDSGRVMFSQAMSKTTTQ